MSDTLTDRIEAWEAGLDDFENPLLVIDKAFCAVATADDPEPPEPSDTDLDRYLDMKAVKNAWRRRQELKAALYDALGKE